ncbi:hypothetical protein [Streptomyces massasporeus]
MLAIPKNEVLPLPDGRTRQARELYALVPEETFEPLVRQRRQGAT